MYFLQESINANAKHLFMFVSFKKVNNERSLEKNKKMVIILLREVKYLPYFHFTIHCLHRMKKVSKRWQNANNQQFLLNQN